MSKREIAESALAGVADGLDALAPTLPAAPHFFCKIATSILRRLLEGRS